MKASAENPIYTTYVVSGGTKYNLSSVVMELNISDPEKQLAQSVTISLANIKTGGKWLDAIISVRDRVYIYADDGKKKDEVFRGFVWRTGNKESLGGNELVLKCYDHLIYCQESEEFSYYSKGKSTKAVFSSLCSKWGIKLSYSYGSITHGKLVLRGNLSDIFIDDLLKLVKDRNGKKYVIKSVKDTMYVMYTGKNSTVYKIESKRNGISSSKETTMDGMITKVVILGKADKEERRSVEATVSGNTSKYGTLQKIITRDEGTSIADAKKEAKNIINENGKPETEYETKSTDIPWIRKGDKVYVNEGRMKGYYIVKSVDRSITNKAKIMTITYENI